MCGGGQVVVKGEKQSLARNLVTLGDDVEGDLLILSNYQVIMEGQCDTLFIFCGDPGALWCSLRDVLPSDALVLWVGASLALLCFNRSGSLSFAVIIAFWSFPWGSPGSSPEPRGKLNVKQVASPVWHFAWFNEPAIDFDSV